MADKLVGEIEVHFGDYVSVKVPGTNERIVGITAEPGKEPGTVRIKINNPQQQV